MEPDHSVGFGPGTGIESMTQYEILAGAPPTVLTVMHDFDFVDVAEGLGSVQFDGQLVELTPGQRIRVPNGTEFVLQSSIASSMRVMVFHVRDNNQANDGAL